MQEERRTKPQKKTAQYTINIVGILEISQL